jgi:Xaa-Pro aminopeptidase
MLYNKERAKEMMDLYEVDCLIATCPKNVGYATEYLTEFACVSNAEFYVVLPRDDSIAPVVISSKVSVDQFVAINSPVEDIRLYAPFYVEESENPGQGEEGFTELQKNFAQLLRDAPVADTMMDALTGVLKEKGLDKARIGLDEKTLSMPEWDAVVESLPQAKIVPGYNILRMIRMVKTPEAIDILRKAALINQTGLQAVLDNIAVGKTEREMFEVFSAAVRKAGGTPYHAIYTGGTQGFLVNKDIHESDTQYGPGGLRLDCDSIYKHHYADMAVTACLGKPSEKLIKLQKAVLTGLRKAQECIKPGAVVADVFNAAVDEVRKNGIPNYKRNHVGHGLGLECYDIPLMSPKVDIKLEPGTVINIEIPYYEINWGSVHVENTFLVTDTGCERFQTMDMELKLL